MNDKTKKKDIGKILGAAALKGSLNKAELKALREAKKLKDKKLKEDKELSEKRKAYKKIMENWDHDTMLMYPERPLSKEQKEKERKKYLLGNAKGGIVKKYKGGLMVKPKAAKRGY